MRDNQELIWVDKDIAERYKELQGDNSKREEQIKIINDYIEGVCNKSKMEFKANLESLDEDVAIYTGLMLKVKQAFEKAKNEQLTASYDLWDKFNEEIPNVTEKIKEITNTINPLREQLDEINSLIRKIDTYDMEKLTNAVKELSSLYGTNKEMIEFLVKNFKKTK